MKTTSSIEVGHIDRSHTINHVWQFKLHSQHLMLEFHLLLSDFLEVSEILNVLGCVEHSQQAGPQY